MHHYAIESCIRQKSLRPIIKKVKGILKLDRKFSLPGNTDISVSFNLRGRPVPVLCTRHTVFVAELIRNSFGLIGVETEIITEEPESYSDRVHIVICPQIYKRLPKKYIAFQMEQITASNRMTRKYKRILSNACYVLDYSLINIKYFRKNQDIANKIFYLPIDFPQGMRRTAEDYEYDVVLYGDQYSTQRKAALDELQKHFSAKIVSESTCESHEDERLNRVESCCSTLSSQVSAFDFYFLRFLLANDWLSFDKFYSLAGDFVHFNSDRVCLSLPETVERTEYFNSVNKYGFEIVPGLRHYRGWTGCGLSYKFIMAKAKEQGFDAITVCEDDVYFPDDFESRFAECEKYLDENPGWDVFQGLNADIGDITLEKLVHGVNQTFIHTKSVVSTVFNSYSSRVFDSFIAWDESDADADKNTIDRSVGSKDLNVVITSPLLVGHNEDLNSSIWDINNKEYASRIDKSNEKLNDLVMKFEENNAER